MNDSRSKEELLWRSVKLAPLLSLELIALSYQCESCGFRTKSAQEEVMHLGRTLIRDGILLIDALLVIFNILKPAWTREVSVDHLMQELFAGNFS